MIKDYQKAWAEAYTKLQIEISNSCWRAVEVAHNHPEEFAYIFTQRYNFKELEYLGEFFKKQSEVLLIEAKRNAFEGLREKEAEANENDA